MPHYKVLIAEDNAINQRLLKEVLGRLGHSGVVVDDGEKALKCLAQLNFDLVLMDIQMPIMDGLQATKQIRAMPEHANLIVIAMTANAMDADRAACLDAGMDEHMPKPFKIETLQTLLAKWALR